MTDVLYDDRARNRNKTQSASRKSRILAICVTSKVHSNDIFPVHMDNNMSLTKSLKTKPVVHDWLITVIETKSIYRRTN